MHTIIFHIDVNSAFLSWSALNKLENGSQLDLRSIPSIICGDTEKRHGVVLAKSIPAKAYHIQTGEPVVNALRKCPTLVMESPNHALYEKKSHELMNFLMEVCPDIEQVSIDECYMDFSSVARSYASPEAAAEAIKNSVKEKFGFTVNIGISNRKILAKMASDFKKPDLVHTLYQHEIKAKMWPLPLSSLYMCGKSSVEILRKFEILTIGDLAQSNPDILVAHMKSHGKLLWEYANGIDDSQVICSPEQCKGIGNSTTLSKDASTREEAFHTLLLLADSVGRRLRSSEQMAGLVSAEIKYNTFQSVSHQMTLPTVTDSTEVIYQTACSLFDKIWNGTPIRLLGIRTGKLQDASAPVQMNLFDSAFLPDSTNTHALHTKPDPEKQHKLDTALDSIRKKYGSSSIIRGSFLDKPDK